MKRSKEFLKLQRKVTIYMERGCILKTPEEKLMEEYIKKSRQLKAELDLVAAQVEILFN